MSYKAFMFFPDPLHFKSGIFLITFSFQKIYFEGFLICSSLVETASLKGGACCHYI